MTCRVASAAVAASAVGSNVGMLHHAQLFAIDLHCYFSPGQPHYVLFGIRATAVVRGARRRVLYLDSKRQPPTRAIDAVGSRDAREYCTEGRLQLQPLPALTYLNFACQRLWWPGAAAGELLPEALNTMTSLQVHNCSATRQPKHVATAQQTAHHSAHVLCPLAGVRCVF
jgi:hypothetical protein